MVPHRSAEGKRIESLKRLINSWRETTSGRSDFLIGMEVEDVPFHPEPFPEDVIVDINEVTLNVIQKINYLSLKYINDYQYIYFVGNDCVFKTKGWEDIFLNEARDKKHVVFYGDDMLQGERLATHAFISTSIIEALGFMAPKCLHHLYVDNYWMSLGKHLNCLQYFPNVILEHMHYSNNKNERDEVYSKGNSFCSLDSEAFNLYINSEFFEDMKRIL